MKLILRISYDGTAGLRHDYESQLKVGGIFASVGAPPETEPFQTIDVQLELPGRPFIRTQARLTVATPESICAEILPDARATLNATITAILDEGPGEGPTERRSVTLADPTRSASEGADSRPLTLDRKIAAMSTSEKIQLALHGDREARALLSRDRVPTIQSALIRNPKTTIDEILAICRSPHLGGEAAEAICAHPTYGASAQIAFALVKNPRTPTPTALGLLGKLSNADLRVVAKGLGVRSQIAAAARKKLFGT